MRISIEKEIHQGLEPIINNPDYKKFPTNFIFPKTVEKNALLFIGINPSSSDDQKTFDSYELGQRNNDHQYFKKFEDISEYCKTNWTHLDLLFFRETNQNSISDILRQDNGVEFIWEQLQIADRLIKMSNPQIIIVSNALARTFLGLDKIGDSNVWLGYDFKFDFELGTHRWGEIPIFFSSMLTGQRALDKGSYERLKWQIRRSLLLLAKEDLETLQINKATIGFGESDLAKIFDKEKDLLTRINALEFKSESIPTE